MPPEERGAAEEFMVRLEKLAVKYGRAWGAVMALAAEEKDIGTVSFSLKHQSCGMSS